MAARNIQLIRLERWRVVHDDARILDRQKLQRGKRVSRCLKHKQDATQGWEKPAAKGPVAENGYKDCQGTPIFHFLMRDLLRFSHRQRILLGLLRLLLSLVIKRFEIYG